MGGIHPKQGEALLSVPAQDVIGVAAVSALKD